MNDQLKKHVTVKDVKPGFKIELTPLQIESLLYLARKGERPQSPTDAARHKLIEMGLVKRDEALNQVVPTREGQLLAELIKQTLGS